MVELADVKKFLRVDWDDDDLVIFQNIEAAENHLTSMGVDLEVDPLPDAIRQAILMLVGHFYEGTFSESASLGINPLIAPYTEITL